MRAAVSLRISLWLAAALLTGACDDPTRPELRRPHTLQLVSGDGQAGTVAQPLADSLVVRVVDWFRRPVAGRTQSGRCGYPLTLAAKLAQIGVEVHLDRVTLRGHEALSHRPLVGFDLGLHLRRRR